MRVIKQLFSRWNRLLLFLKSLVWRRRRIYSEFGGNREYIFQLTGTAGKDLIKRFHTCLILNGRENLLVRHFTLTWRSLSQTTFHTMDFMCRCVASTRIQRQCNVFWRLFYQLLITNIPTSLQSSYRGKCFTVWFDVGSRCVYFSSVERMCSAASVRLK